MDGYNDHQRLGPPRKGNCNADRQNEARSPSVAVDSRIFSTPRHAKSPRPELVNYVEETPSRSPITTMSTMVQWGSSPAADAQARKEEHHNLWPCGESPSHHRLTDPSPLRRTRSSTNNGTVSGRSGRSTSHWAAAGIPSTPSSRRHIKRVRSVESPGTENLKLGRIAASSINDQAQAQALAQIRRELSDLLPGLEVPTKFAPSLQPNPRPPDVEALRKVPLARSSSGSGSFHRPHVALELECDLPPPRPPSVPATPCKNKTCITTSDGFVDEEDDGFWDMHADEIFDTMDATQHPPPAIAPAAGDFSNDTIAADIPPPQVPGLPHTRYSVLRAHPNPHSGELLIQAMVLPDTQIRTIILRDVWRETVVEPGDVLHIIESNGFQYQRYFPDEGATVALALEPVVVDANQRLVIAHPDFLVSGSTACEVHGCLRRAVVKERVRGRDVNMAQILGTITHEFLQYILLHLDEARDLQRIESAAAACIQRHAVSMYVVGLTPEQIQDHLNEMHTLFCQSFLDEHVGQFAKSPWQLSEVLDVEENVWAPTVGLKGKIDATVSIRAPRRPPFSRQCHDSGISMQSQYGDPRAFRPNANEVTGVVPLEIKTGKARELPHRAQTALYAILFAESYLRGYAMDCGILYNITASDTNVVPLVHAELRDLMHLRNQFATAMKKRHVLPKVLGPGNAATCTRCFSAPVCMVAHKALEGGSEKTAGIGDAQWEQHTGHLSQEHIKFLSKWNRLIALEDEVQGESKADIWRLPPKNQAGCMGQLTLLQCREYQGSDAYLARFKDQTMDLLSQIPLQQRRDSVNAFNRGDLVVISVIGGPYALAQGYVHSCTLDSVSVILDRPIRPARHLSRARQPSHLSSGLPGVLYRVDVLEMQSMAAIMRNSLFNLFTSKASRMRDLVVDLIPPQFDQTQVPHELLSTILDNLNASQRAMVEHSFSARDYALVVGMPGTGKTTALAHMLAAMHRHGLRVLLTSHTHNAVDTVLLKLKELDTPFLRLGSRDRVHSDLSDYVLDGRSPEEIPAVVGDAQIVGVTCLGSGHPLLLKPVGTPSVQASASTAATSSAHTTHFDVCIVDEASQIMLPVAMGPLALADRFILVGDHNQLSPVVRSAEAAEEGLSVSLFEHLLKAHPRAATYLDVQYRMNDEITALVNFATYHDRLTCGTEEVSRARLTLPRRIDPNIPNWIRAVLTGSSVVFVDTRAPEQVVGTNLNGLNGANGSSNSTTGEGATGSFGVINMTQVDMVKALVRALVTHNVAPEDIGIITPYRVQLARIREALGIGGGPGGGMIGEFSSPVKPTDPADADSQLVECCTIDQYQGRDKKVIIVSLVRCNQGSKTGDLLRDWKRINVAFTRARIKLVLIGCATTLKGSLLWSTLLEFIESRKWLVLAY